MRHVARVSDPHLVYQVVVTKSICFVSALFDKLFIVYKNESLKQKKMKQLYDEGDLYDLGQVSHSPPCLISFLST